DSLGPRMMRHWAVEIGRSDRHLVTVRSFSGHVVGFMPFHSENGMWFINGWFVLPGWQNIRLGRLLMQAALDNIGPAEIQVDVTVGIGVLESYMRYGFVPTGEETETPARLEEYKIRAPQQHLVRPAAESESR
ncbi:GNAT family N-acetyltransferase, partial [Streptomyces sp. NPDC059083]|uniref:GNAT family N-acetyltransferase n=1 Tax=Streptomyces sp. NPDC059083 TaxID=3346721 RepID=UPI0036C53AF2